MKISFPTFLVIGLGLAAAHRSSRPLATDNAQLLTYYGVHESGVEAFLGIRYGQDTSGSNRFKPPRPYRYQPHTRINAQVRGPACPQSLGNDAFPLNLSNITDISEDCLLLNIGRPNGTTTQSKLPVMVFIHGGSFISSSKDELSIQPSGLILESVANHHPVVHVGINYRLGVFGFAQSSVLKKERSENAGLRDQRLALEWVHHNIAVFGGDPDKITVFGQSSGGLSVGMQIMAYGGAKPVPFQQTIGESQMLETGITGNYTSLAMARILDAVGCSMFNHTPAQEVSCLRELPLQTLLDAQTTTHLTDASANLGDEWLPVVDGDFVPDAPSQLVAEGKFAMVSSIIGWVRDDANIIAPMSIRTAQDTDAFLRGLLPGFTNESIDVLQSLYPVDDFQPLPATNLTAEFTRSARIFRDIQFVCIPMRYGQAIAAKGNPVYYYEQNQTFLNPALTAVGLPDIGFVHTSELAYVFGNLSHYKVGGVPFKPKASDHDLLRRQSRSWSSFAALGRPFLEGGTTLQGWTPAYEKSMEGAIFIIGSSSEGLSTQTDGINVALDSERLEDRCGFLNSPNIIKQLQY